MASTKKKSLKLLAFADLHISNRNSTFLFTGKVSDLLIAQEKYVEHVANLARLHEVDAILFLGDWTDYPTMDTVTLTYNNRLIKLLSDEGIPVIFIEGNHCIEDVELQYTVISATAEMSDPQSPVYFIHQPETVAMVLKETEVQFHCFPFKSDYKTLESEIAEKNSTIANDDKTCHVMLFHFPSVNAILDNGVNSIRGVNVAQEYISNFAVVLGGDFHKPQQLINTDRAYYVGAPFDLKHGEHLETRGTSLVNLIFEKGVWKHEVELIANPYLIPIEKLSAEEFLSKSDEELSSGVYRVVGEIDDKTSLLIKAKRKTAYRLDVAKTKKRIDKGVIKKAGVIGQFGISKEIDIFKEIMIDKEVEEETAIRVGKLFEQIRG
jgi:DNA repair exonuclease SbcCD nuclease subunit